MDERSQRDKMIYLLTFFADFEPVPSTSKTKSTRRSGRYQGFLSESEAENDQEYEVDKQIPANDSDESEDQGKLRILSMERDFGSLLTIHLKFLNIL